MRKICIIILAAFTFLSASGQQEQQDPEARKILDRLSRKAQADYPLQISFEYIYESLIDKETHRQNGTLVLQEEKFRLTFGESEVYCDGTTLWNHLVVAGEVYVSDAEDGSPSDEFFLSNPSQLFTFYKENFKYRLKGEVEYSDEQFMQVDLFPFDLDKSYHTIRLLIRPGDNTLYSAEALGKHGINHTVIIKKYNRKMKTAPDTFVFRPEEHPGLEIVDTRF